MKVNYFKLLLFIPSFFIFNFSFLIIFPVIAQEIPVNIKADSLQIVEGTSRVEASGSVEVQLKGIIIRADHLWLDSDSNIATAEGHVRITNQEYSATADSLAYNANNETTDFCNFSTKLMPNKVKGNLYLSAQKISDLNDKMIGRGGELSTCDNPEEHYYVTADRVEYYQDDKLIAYNCVVHIGKMPLFWLPVIYYDLGEDWRRNWIFGHNNVEGNYVKSTWGYPLGLLYLDLMEKKGFGAGTALNYGLGALGAGALYLYHLDEKDTGLTDWVTRIKHTKQITPQTTLTLNQEFAANYLIPAGRKDQTALGLSLSNNDQARANVKFNNFVDRQAQTTHNDFSFDRSFEKSSTSYNYTYDYAQKEPFWIRAAQHFTHRQPLAENVMLSAKADYYNNVANSGQAGDERLDPQIELTGSDKNYNWRLTSNWYLDVDRDTYSGDDNVQYLEKKPELEITPKVLDLYYVNLRPKFGYGFFHEVAYVSLLGRNRSFATDRYQATLDVDKAFPLGTGNTFSFGLGLDQFAYGPGDQLYSYREKARLASDQWGFLRNDLNFRKGRADGNSPFMFDKLGTAYHDVTDRLEFYYKNYLNWSFDGGHNWQTHKWFDVNSGLTIKPTEKVTWSLRSGWDIENIRYKDLVNNLSLTPVSFFSVAFGTVSDLNSGLLRSGSLLYDLFLLEKQPNQWRFKVSQVFDSTDNQFKVRDIMISKELHCWIMNYSYSDYRKEFSLTFSLKALPDMPLGMSSGRGVYFDALENQVKGLMNEGQVNRY
jgi:hypothetical protein